MWQIGVLLFRDVLFGHFYHGPLEVTKIVNSERLLCMYIFYSAEYILCIVDGSYTLQVQRKGKGESVHFSGKYIEVL